MLKTSR